VNRVEGYVPTNDLVFEQLMSICVVVVIYNRRIATSPTCLSLLKQEWVDPRDTIVVYDNSLSSSLGEIPAGWEVILDPSNGGLLRAYSGAVSRAKEEGCDWVLLLDQDTNLPRNFLATVHEAMARMRFNSEVVAIVPTVQAGTVHLSPMLPRLGREIPFQQRDVVVANGLMALNSGTCLRTDFIESIGGFSSKFWLDYLDHWLFKMISNRHKSVFVSSAVVQHDLSVFNMNNGMTVQRYKNVLFAERQFTNDYLTPLWRGVLIPRLLARALKHLIVTNDKRLALLMVTAAGAQLAALVRIVWTAKSSPNTPAARE
jgi:Glycosyl transferase family 2